MRQENKTMGQLNAEAAVLKRRSSKLIISALALKRALDRKAKKEARLVFVKKLKMRK